MSTQFHFGRTEVTLTFSWLAAITGFKRKLSIPYSSIKSVQAGPFEERVTALPTGGVSLPYYRTGRFFHNGKRTFIAHTKRNPAVILELDSSSFYQRIVVECQQPEEIKQQLMEHCPQFKSVI